ncbi:MAG: cupin domain-containing protein [Candidatus Riflebacteria bacterium]|nr:cupin domain-containing protein [Candidatus Riflebacteria bacterium]
MNNFSRFSRIMLAALFFAGIFANIPSALAKKKKEKKPEKEVSHNFFSFSDAPYFTSPDKRIGAKLLIDSTKVGPTFASMQHLTLLPQANIKSHRHVYVHEIVYILKGNLVLRIADEMKVIGPDTTAYIPPKTFHEYMNDSTDVCQFLQFYSPSGPEEEYRSWELPGAAKTASDTVSEVASQPKEIVQPKRGPVPGSPKTFLGKVSEVQKPAAETTK